MAEVVTMGEAMLRLSPVGYRRLEQADRFEINVGGSELNVAAGISRLGLSSSWISKLPNNPLGRMVANKAREHGVDTSQIVWTNEGRVGIYYLELGSAPRASSVIYDRGSSTASELTPGEVNWQVAFKGARLFHVSGITPALSESCAEVVGESIREAKNQGCRVSFDINYRAKLWSGEEARRCLSKLLGEVDIIITTQFDAEEIFGLKDSYEEVARKLKEMFKPSVVVITLREVKTVLTGGWRSIALADKLYTGKSYDIEIIDRVGAGDAYTAGFLYGYLSGDIEKGISFGDAMAALQQTIPGDLSWFSLKEVEKHLGGKDFRIQR